MKQFSRYAIIGIISNLTGYVVYLLLTWFGVGPKTAMTIVYLTAATIGFFGNRKWTFDHKGRMIPAFFRYASVHACGYGLNYAILYIFVDRMMFPHELVQAIAILLVAVFLFITFRIFVFSNP